MADNEGLTDSNRHHVIVIQGAVNRADRTATAGVVWEVRQDGVRQTENSSPGSTIIRNSTLVNLIRDTFLTPLAIPSDR